jgi:hypothetical protein
MHSARYFCPILNKSGFSQQNFMEVPQYETSQKSVQYSCAVICGQREAHQTSQWALFATVQKRLKNA